MVIVYVQGKIKYVQTTCHYHSFCRQKPSSGIAILPILCSMEPNNEQAVENPYATAWFEVSQYMMYTSIDHGVVQPHITQKYGKLRSGEVHSSIGTRYNIIPWNVIQVGMAIFCEVNSFIGRCRLRLLYSFEPQ